jgi:putative glycosyltransferase (TIGR04372 family)
LRDHEVGLGLNVGEVSDLLDPRFANPVEFPAGRRRQNPFRVVALALDRTLGDFATVVCYAASIKEQFEFAKLSIYFRNDRPYKADILKVCPQVDEIFEMTGEDSLPLDSMDRASNPTIGPPNHWYSSGWNYPNLLVTPSMAGHGNFNAFERPARFRFPDELALEKGAALADAGVDLKRWFVVIHYREPGYDRRPADPFRDVDPTAFEAVTRWIIDDLGGQVVRIGHPGMSVFTERLGFIDLSATGDSDFLLQLFAISRARFMFASNSGPVLCGSAFGTPTAMVNCFSRYSVWNSQDAKMWCHILAPDGRRVPHEVAIERDMYFVSALKHLKGLGYTIEQQSVEELKHLIDLMIERTLDTPGWRDGWYDEPGRDKPNKIILPAPRADRTTHVEFPSPLVDP